MLLKIMLFFRIFITLFTFVTLRFEHTIYTYYHHSVFYNLVLSGHKGYIQCVETLHAPANYALRYKLYNTCHKGYIQHVEKLHALVNYVVR